MPAPEFPPTLVVSCREVELPIPLEPMRSTFCYVNESKYLSGADVIEHRRQWDTFERIENYNSIILDKLAQTVPKPHNGTAGNGYGGGIFYNFIDQQERNDYLAGQRAHITALPNVDDFLIPYSKKPIPYTSSVISTLATESGVITIGPCPEEKVGKPIPYEELLNNRKAQNVYIKVSTQTALYPKSSYKFSNAQEYLMYKQYKEANC